jgi:hypothetical protein
MDPFSTFKLFDSTFRKRVKIDKVVQIPIDQIQQNLVESTEAERASLVKPLILLKCNSKRYTAKLL